MKKKEEADQQEPGEEKSKTGTRYSAGQKIDAIVWLDATRNTSIGELNPNFSQVSKRLSISDNTLRSWWEQRDQIVRQAGAEIATLSDIMMVELGAEIKKIIAELRKRGYEKFSNSDLTKALKEFNMQFRLVRGKPTEILHTGKAGDYVPILPDYKPGLIDLGEAKVIENGTGEKGEKKDNATK